MAALEVHENAFVFSVTDFPQEPTYQTYLRMMKYHIRNFGTQTFTFSFWRVCEWNEHGWRRWGLRFAGG